MDIAAILRSPERMLQIKASAGSGKTYTLTRLFLNRLARCNMAAGEAGTACLLRHDGPAHWGEILAITFTNAAATEMRDRVVTTLKNVALGHPARDIPLSSGEAAAWLEIILRDIATLNIRTIDSLLHRIVRAAALDLGLPPDFQPVFASDEAMQPRLDRLLDEAWHGDADKLALLRDVYGEMIHQSDRKGFVAGGHLVRRLRELWDGFLDGSFSRLSAPDELAAREAAVWDACRLAAVTFLREAEAAGVEVSANGRKACAKIAEGNATFCASAMFADGGGKLLKGRAARPAPLLEAVNALVRAVEKAGQLLPVLAEAGKYARMVRLAQWLCEDFARDSRKDGNIPAVLIPLKAVEALSGEYGVPEALCRLGSRLRHFMLDEFQDTSRRQWEAMFPLVAEALSQGGSLSWVGDVKQAIYGWRGGDTHLFDELARDRELLGMAEACRRESLPFNRRSRRGIVAYNNGLFSLLADADVAREALTSMLGSSVPPEMLEDGVASVTEAYAEAAQACPDDAPDGGLIRVCDAQAVADGPALPDGGEEEDDGEEATESGQAVGRTLLRTVREIGARRPWSDLLVLVETNNMAHDYAALLMEDGIPVITENSLLLAEHPLVMQLVAFLRFLDRPEDDVALWTVLNGSLLAGHPACGLDSGELHDWRASHVCAVGQLRQAFRAFRPAVWEAFLAPFLSRAGLMTPYDTLMEWCNRLDARQRFPEAAVFLRCFMEVLASAEENGLDSSSAFLYHWEQKGGLEKVPMPDKLEAVRVMTIHKSKGLEAPAVVLPLTGRRIKGDRVALVERDGLRVVCKARAAMGEPYYRERVRQAVERINQLYVAFTRAREELHVIRPPARGRGDGGGVAAMNCLWRQAGWSVPHTEGCPPPVASPSPSADGGRAEVPVPPEAETVDAHGANGLEAGPWRPMQWLPTLKIFRNPLGTAFRARDRGEFLHHCLIRLNGTTGDAATRAAVALQRGEESFARALPPDASLRQGVLSALTWAAGQPLLLDWLERGHAEQGLLLPWGDGLRAGRADVIVPGRRRYLILEFKSGQPDAAHVAQLRGYLSCLPHDLPATGLLVYLDERRFRRVDADGASAEQADLEQVFPLYHEV